MTTARSLVHKVIEPGGESALPYALSKLADLEVLGIRYISKTYLHEGRTVIVKVAGDQRFVYVGGTPIAYEFFCSDPGVMPTSADPVPYNAVLYTDGDSANLYDRAIAGCGVRAHSSGGSPAFSNTLKPETSPDAKTWSMVPIPKGPRAKGVPEQVKFFTGNDYTPATGNAWQLQKGHEYTWWSNNTNHMLVTSCLGIGLGKSYQNHRSWLSSLQCWVPPSDDFIFLGRGAQEGAVISVDYYWNLVFNGAWGCYTAASYSGALTFSTFNQTHITEATTTSAGPRTYTNVIYSASMRIGNASEIAGNFDVMPSTFTTKFSYESAYKRTPNANWRRAAVQKVKVGNDYQFYVISSDRQGSFCAYRVQQYSYPYDQVTGSKVQVVNPTYPAWCSVPADTADPGLDPELDYWVFTFNKDGTKASSTPFERVPAYMWVGSSDGLGTSTDRVASSLPLIPYYGTFGLGADGVFYRSPVPPGTPDQFMVCEWLPWAAWPLPSYLSTIADPVVTQKYKVLRKRVQIHKSQGQLGTTAVEVGDFGLVDTHIGHAFNTDLTTLNSADYEPAFICKPGFIELGFIITVLDPKYPDTFTFQVNVLQEEAYSVNKRMYLDTGYFSKSLRHKKSSVVDDTLLTAEIEAYVKEPDYVASIFPPNAGIPLYSPANITGRRLPWMEYSTGLKADTFSTMRYIDTYNHTLADEPNCEGAWISQYHGDIELYYVVRERNTQNEVERFCLAKNINWFANNVYPSVRKEVTHVGSVRHANLRNLDFITCSFTLKPDSTETILAAHPRYELRVFGEEMRTINTGDDETHGFYVEYDPMKNHAPEKLNYTKLPTPFTPASGSATHATGAPDSFLLSLQLWASDNLFLMDVFLGIPSHPNGSWSCYLSSQGIGREFNNSFSTNPNYVFDIIKPFKGKESTHKDQFNSAFEQKRDYYDYYKNVNEQGGFCTFGIWYNLAAFDSKKA